MSNPLHPTVGPEDYISPYSDIDYSKGPKIIYGDTEVFTVVLNDAQSDEDDEWGRTEQIALRMVIDEAVSVHKEVFGWSGILGVKDKFEILAGMFVGLGPNYDNPDASILSIGGTRLQDALLTLGSGTFISTINPVLSLSGGAFTIETNPSTLSNTLKAINIGDYTSIILAPASGDNKIILNINGVLYQFTSTSLNIPDTLIATTINADTFTCVDLSAITLNLQGTESGASIVFGVPGDAETRIEYTPDSGLGIAADLCSISLYYKLNGIDTTLNTVFLYELETYEESTIEEMLLRLVSNVQIEGNFYITAYSGPNSEENGMSTIHLFHPTYDVVLRVWETAGVAKFIIGNCTIFDFGQDIEESGANSVRILAGADSGDVNTPWNGVEIKGLVESDPTQVSVGMNILTGRVANSSTSYYYGLIFERQNESDGIILNNTTGLYLFGSSYTYPHLEINNSTISLYTGENLDFKVDSGTVTLFNGEAIAFEADYNGIIAGDETTKFKVTSIVVPNKTWPAIGEDLVEDLTSYTTVPTPEQCYSVSISVYDKIEEVLFVEDAVRFQASYQSFVLSLKNVDTTEIAVGNIVDLRVTFIYNAVSIVSEDL